MKRRQKTSSGQTIVMVTLALLAMAGMMGLAVDLGWSFFVQKAAQAAADGAALAAVQAAYRAHGGGLGTLSCSPTVSDCEGYPGVPVSCASISSSSNLYNGCRYAIKNDFDYTSDLRTTVTVQSYVCSTNPCSSGSAPPTVTGITNIKYWVTVRTIRTIPQLFSALGGNTQGTVSAIATAAIVGSIGPGSFYGLNHEGDCVTGNGSTVVAKTFCGVDVNLTSTGSATCQNMDGTSSGVVGKLCAPAGIFLASQCNGSSLPTGATAGDCGSGNSNFAGQTTNNPDVWAQAGTQIIGNGAVNKPSNWLPSVPTNQSTANFSDPTRALPQPPLVNSSQPLCAVTSGSLPSGTTVGPYQYYAATYNSASNKWIPTGGALTVGNFSGNSGALVFSSTSTNCPGTAVDSTGTPLSTSPTTSGFGTFTFWGGMNINGNANTAVTFGAGQYVMAGTNSQTGTVFSASSGTITGDSSSGTQFIFTDGRYGSALTEPAVLSSNVTLYQGFVDIKGAAFDLTAVTSNAPALTDYKNILFWQDRLNSQDTLNPANGDCASTGCHGTLPTSVTSTSAQFDMEPGNASMSLKGVIYQPRGAWFTLGPGGSSTAGTLQLQLITGAIVDFGGAGNSTVALAGPSSPIVTYITALIQ